MGINDKDYADALVYEKQKQAQQQQMEKEMSISGATGLSNLIGSMGGAGQNALQSNGTGLFQSAQAQQAALGAYQNTAAQQAYTSATTQLSYPTNNGITLNTGIKTLNEQDLKHDAMLAPLSALVDMWTVRWGGEWVSEDAFQEDDFWRLALIRLVGANKLEKHHLANQYAAVYRIIE